VGEAAGLEAIAISTLIADAASVWGRAGRGVANSSPSMISATMWSGTSHRSA